MTRARTFAVLVAPLPAMVVGALVMRAAGIGRGIWLQNLGATLVGLSAAGLAWGRRGSAPRERPTPLWPVLAGVALLASSLLGPGLEGVHRWLPLGVLRLHAGGLLLPPLLVALGFASWSVAVAAAFAVLLVLVIQPDAGQAAAFGMGWIALALARPGRGSVWVALGSVALAAASVLRVDPLEPVAHVEGIVGMASAQGMAWAGLGLLSLAVLPLALLWGLERPVGLSLGAYLAGMLAAAALGDHPVPVLGYGASPILGYYAALVVHAALGSGQRPPAPSRGGGPPRAGGATRFCCRRG